MIFVCYIQNNIKEVVIYKFEPFVRAGMVKYPIFLKKSIISDIINFQPDIYDILKKGLFQKNEYIHFLQMFQSTFLFIILKTKVLQPFHCTDGSVVHRESIRKSRKNI